MSDLSIRGIQRALADHSRRTTIGDWVVASGATTTSIPTTKTDGTAVNLSSDVITDLTDSMIAFEAPGANEGVYRHVTAVTSGGTLTLDEALPHGPSKGDPFTILAQMQVDVTSAENVRQWAGTAVAAPDGDNADGVAPVTSGVPLFLSRLTGWTGTAWSRLKLAASGSLTTKDDANGTTGSAVPSTAIQIGGSDGTDLRALTIDSSGRLILAPSGSLAAGTFNVATTAGALPSQACTEVLIQAGTGNADAVSIGNSSSQPISLAAGQSVSLSISNLNLVYAVASATGNTLGWMVRS